MIIHGKSNKHPDNSLKVHRASSCQYWPQQFLTFALTNHISPQHRSQRGLIFTFEHTYLQWGLIECWFSMQMCATEWYKFKITPNNLSLILEPCHNPLKNTKKNTHWSPQIPQPWLPWLWIYTTRCSFHFQSKDLEPQLSLQDGGRGSSCREGWEGGGTEGATCSEAGDCYLFCFYPPAPYRHL